MKTEYSELITLFFGQEFSQKTKRHSSYFLLERIVDLNSDVNGVVDTISAIEDLRKLLSKMSIQEISFLLTHSGNIPDHFPPDGSLETLHSKLTETLVAEWGKLTGAETELIKEKSNREDIKFTFESGIIVCDAKSFRLGRSQSAPNPKDTIKRGDYQKWLSAYPKDKQLGGIVTFPSMHDWKTKSDVYLYCTENSEPILMLHYEHLAYILLNWGAKKTSHVDTILSSYSQIFPNSSNKKTDYWSKVEPMISDISKTNNLKDFKVCSDIIIQESVAWAKNRIIERIRRIEEDTEKEVRLMQKETLRGMLTQTLVGQKVSNLQRYLKNIEKFR